MITVPKEPELEKEGDIRLDKSESGSTTKPVEVEDQEIEHP